MRNLLITCFTAFLIASCSDDAPESALVDLIVTHEITTHTVTANGVLHEQITDYLIEDNKRISYASELFLDGILNSAASGTNFYYDSQGRLTNVNYEPNANYLYYYDLQGRLAGFDNGPQGMSIKHWRYTYFAGGVVYGELLDAPYNDASAQILARFIATVNGNGAVTSVGKDGNLDGIAETINTFSINAQDDIDTVVLNGVSYSLTYSNVVNTGKILSRTTIGPTVCDLINLDYLASADMDVVLPRLFSRHLTTTEFGTGSFEVVNGWVSKNTKIETVQVGEDFLTTTTVTEFVFE